MGWLSKVLGGGALQGVSSIIGRFKMDPAVKAKLENALIERDMNMEKTIQQELSSREKILVAELTQGDNFTKRARPAVVWTGLGVVVLNYVLGPMVVGAWNLFAEAPIVYSTYDLPDAFWLGWSGIVATYSLGRSLEKRKGQERKSSILD